MDLDLGDGAVGGDFAGDANGFIQEVDFGRLGPTFQGVFKDDDVEAALPLLDEVEEADFAGVASEEDLALDGRDAADVSGRLMPGENLSGLKGRGRGCIVLVEPGGRDGSFEIFVVLKERTSAGGGGVVRALGWEADIQSIRGWGSGGRLGV